jgi:HSP20 family protein
MTLARWDSIRALNNLQNEMNHLFSDFGGAAMNAPMTREPMWTPVADVLETADDYRIQVALPGVDPKDVEVRLDGTLLTVAGERRLEDVKETQTYSREMVYGSFHRAFTLPASPEARDIRANYRDGLLRITVPKSPSAKPKQIAVKAA